MCVVLPDGQVRSGSWSEIHDRAGGCSVGTEWRHEHKPQIILNKVKNR